MSKAYNSPTARLLQSSRLFSLPRPLPQPALENPSSTGAHRASDSATVFYPTHQAIATPASSHHRGDWGLKRAIPGKTTRSSTPSIRVLGQDTSDHITEFESAADHERSRAKWAEMGVPIMARSRRERNPTVSVYEDSIDNTDPNAAPVVVRSGADITEGPQMAEAKRWKYKGPFVAGMQEGEFQRYVQRQLRVRREEWSEYLLDHFAKQNFEKERNEARENGLYHGPFESAAPRIQAQLVVMEAEANAEQLLQDILGSGQAEQEAKVRHQGEGLVAAAREQAQRYELEASRWEAPEQARNILVQAQRTANAEMANQERARNERELNAVEGATEEAAAEQAAGEEKLQAIISDGVASVYHLLGEEFSASMDIAGADRLIRASQQQVKAAQNEKLRLLNEWKATRIPQLRPSLEQLSELEKDLRDKHASENLSSDLSTLITGFLDIPPVKAETSKVGDYAKTSSFHIETQKLNDRDVAPPTTHPAAGLSHIRTNAFMENHPIHGPQAYPSPIMSRVLMARSSLRSNNSHAQLGVGGFVADDPLNGGFNGRNSRVRGGQDEDPAHILNPDLPHGNKLYVHPNSAIIDEAGRIRLNVSRADNEAVAVKENDVEHIHEGRGAGAARSSSFSLPPAPRAPRANYGFGLPDSRRMSANEEPSWAPRRGGRPQSRVSGYDAEAAKLGKVSEDRTLEMIQELSKGVNNRQ